MENNIYTRKGQRPEKGHSPLSVHIARTLHIHIACTRMHVHSCVIRIIHHTGTRAS